MILHVINSNSKGNSYILTSDNGEVLLIECGVRFEKIKRALNFQLNRVAGCILTHEHADHSKAIHEVLSAGINVWASKGTHEECNTSAHHRARVTADGHVFQVGSFKVMAFDVQHDVKEPLGFLIHHSESGNVLFLTDTYYVKNTFKNLHNIIIEANYCQGIVDDRVARGTNPKYLRDRVLESHMSIDTCKKTLAANDLSKVNNIVLIHLSDGNSDAVRFKKEVEEQTGKIVHIADAGLNISFNKKPF
jgi:phosphoribosyl 1,2-cyclic phosphodiesterase